MLRWNGGKPQEPHEDSKAICRPATGEEQAALVFDLGKEADWLLQTDNWDLCYIIHANVIVSAGRFYEDGT